MVLRIEVEIGVEKAVDKEGECNDSKVM